MKALLTQLWIQFRSDTRNKTSMITTYVVPLIYYLLIGYITAKSEARYGLILSMTIFAISLMSYSILPQKLITSREYGILETYRVGGIPSWSYLFCSVVITTFHIMVISVIIFLTAPIFFNQAPINNILGHFGIVFLVALCSEALGILVSCLISNPSSMPIVTLLLLFPSMIPASYLPKPFQYVLQFLPSNLAQNTMGNNLLPSVLTMLGITITASIISVFMFKRITRRK